MVLGIQGYCLMGVLCPACKLRCCVSRINMDYAECPDHGIINGIVMLQCRGMVPWKALIEIRAAQAYEAIHRLADYHRGEIIGAGIQRVTKHEIYQDDAPDETPHTPA